MTGLLTQIYLYLLQLVLLLLLLLFFLEMIHVKNK